MATGGTGTATNTLRTILGGTPLIGDSLAIGNTTIEDGILSISSINANNAYVLSAFVSEAYINKLYLPEISVVSLNADYGRISRLSGVSLSFTGGFVNTLSGTALTYAAGFFANQVSALNGNISQLNVSTAMISNLNVSTANISDINVSTITAGSVNATRMSSTFGTFASVSGARANFVFLENVAMSSLSGQILELYTNSVEAGYISAGILSVNTVSANTLSAQTIRSVNASINNLSVGTLCTTTIVAGDITVSNALRVSKSGFQLNLGGGMTLGSPPGAWINTYNGTHTAFQAEQQGVTYKDIFIQPQGGNTYLGQATTNTIVISNKLQIGGNVPQTEIQTGPGLLTVGNTTVSDITVNGTVDGHATYLQMGLGGQRPLWFGADAVSNQFFYMGLTGGDGTNPDMLVTLKQQTGIQITSGGPGFAPPDFNEQLVVLGRARISDLALGTASVLSFQAVSAFISYISVISLSAANISVGNLSVGSFVATNINVSGGYVDTLLNDTMAAQTGNFGLMQAISARFRSIEEVKSWGSGVLSVVITNSTRAEGYMLMPGNPGLRPCFQFVSHPAPSPGIIAWTFPIPFTIPLGVQGNTTTSTTTISVGKTVFGIMSEGGVNLDPNYGAVTKSAAYIIAYGLV